MEIDTPIQAILVGSRPLDINEDTLDFDTGSESSVTSGHYSTAESSARSSHSRSNKKFAPHHLLHIPSPSSSSPPVSSSDDTPTDAEPQTTSVPGTYGETAIIPNLPPSRPTSTHSSVKFANPHTTLIDSTFYALWERAMSSSVSQHDGTSSHGAATITIRGSSAYKIGRTQSYSYTDRDRDTDGASSFFARPRPKYRARYTLTTEESSLQVLRKRLLAVLRIIFGPILLPIRYCTGMNSPAYPPLGAAHRYGSDPCLTFGEEQVQEPEEEGEEEDLLSPYAVPSGSSGRLLPELIKRLEEQVEKLEAALVQERKKREALATANSVEFKRLHKMLRDTLLG